MNFLGDLRFALRSLACARGLVLTVVVTLALGIGANAAIFTVVQGVLLRPLTNREEDRLVYIRQTAPGLGVDNANFSVPELRDLQSSVRSFTGFGDFSPIEFTMVGLGEPRVVRAGVVGGSYFQVMGLSPIHGRLIDATDDGPAAAGARADPPVLGTTLNSDPTLVGRTVRLGDRAATIIGVLQPTVPYPADTEIIANVVTSPHHLDATMVDGRVHRMTELFGRLAPGADLETAKAELRTAHAAMMADHAEAYPKDAQFRIEAVKLRDQITSSARTVLLVLLAAAALVFVIACANVANLILARSVRREGELAVRAALGASAGALRRTLLAESLLLCGAGAVLGVLLAGPMVSVLARYAARFSVRALDLTVDASLLWVGATLAMLAAVLLAFVPRLPSADSAHGPSLAAGGVRLTSGTNRRLRLFAVTQIAACFVLLAGAAMLMTTLFRLQATETGFNLRQVLAVNVPVSFERPRAEIAAFYREIIRRVGELPARLITDRRRAAPRRRLAPAARGGGAEGDGKGERQERDERARAMDPHTYPPDMSRPRPPTHERRIRVAPRRYRAWPPIWRPMATYSMRHARSRWRCATGSPSAAARNAPASAALRMLAPVISANRAARSSRSTSAASGTAPERSMPVHSAARSSCSGGQNRTWPASRRISAGSIDVSMLVVRIVIPPNASTRWSR